MYATTSQFARLTGVTAKALQLYERRGLLKPRRTRAGYRRYTYTDLLRLERVLALKGLGLSLKQIALLARDGSRVSGVMTRQRELLDERRRRIDRAVGPSTRSRRVSIRRTRSTSLSTSRPGIAGRRGGRNSRRRCRARRIAPARRASPCSKRSTTRSNATRAWERVAAFIDQHADRTQG